MRWWIAVASALVALLVVPAALAGGDHDRSGRDGKSYDKRHDDGDRRGDWSRHDRDDDDRRDYDKRDKKHDDYDKDRDHDKDYDRGKDKDKDGDHGSYPKPQDVCPNVEGYQSTVPSMLVKDSSGNCVAPTLTVAASSVASSPPVVAAALPSVLDVRPQAVKPKAAKKVKKVKKKAKKVRAKKAKRKVKRAVRSRRAASFPRVLPFTR
jgi:hypothetical protein